MTALTSYLGGALPSYPPILPKRKKVPFRGSEKMGTVCNEQGYSVRKRERDSICDALVL